MLKCLISWVVLATLAAGGAPGRVLSLEEVNQRLSFYKTLKTLKTTFKQVKRLKDVGIEMKSEGTLTLTRPDKIIWRVTQPAFVELQMHGKRVDLITGEGKETKKQTWGLEEALDSNTHKSLEGLVSWLQIDIPTLHKHYEIHELGVNQFRCVPRGNSFVTALRLQLHPKGHLEKLWLEEKSGDEIELTFNTPTVSKHSHID